MVSAIYILAESGWMIILQLFLLRAQHYYQTNPRKRPLTSFEKCIIATALWTVFLMGSYVYGLLFRFATIVLLSAGNTTPEAVPTQQHRSLSGTGPIVYKVLATWLIHKAINFFLETVLPFWEEMFRDSDGVRLKFEARARELLEGIREFRQEHGLLSRYNHDRTRVIRGGGQEICLERHQIDDPATGQRTLEWNIVVDKNALDEMKETLGPPGGFGELGFNVLKDGVCFEAMGVGTRFNLRFALESAPANVKGGKEGPTKAKKGRSNRY